MSKYLILLLAALAILPGAILPGAARAAPSDAAASAVMDMPAIEDVTTGAAAAPSNMRYKTGAFFYGSDCGGSSAMTAGALRSNAAPGLILGGAAERQIALGLDCDDRRNAMASYRDAFQGVIGQPYAWHNPVDDAGGNVTATRHFSEDAAPCAAWRAVAIIDRKPATSSGTACRRPDGNWHTQ